MEMFLEVPQSKRDTFDFQRTRILVALMEMFFEVPQSRLGAL